MEPERRRHQFQPLRALRARASRQAGPRNTTQESSKFFIYRDSPELCLLQDCVPAEPVASVQAPSASVSSLYMVEDLIERPRILG